MSTVPEATTVAEDKTAAILAYITLLGFIAAIVIHSGKKTALGGFHLRQMLGLILTGFAVAIGSAIMAIIPFIGWLISLVLYLGFLVFWVMGLISAINGQQKPLPVVGELYQKWFASAFA
jgi:uncharacterized membrane protein